MVKRKHQFFSNRTSSGGSSSPGQQRFYRPGLSGPGQIFALLSSGVRIRSLSVLLLAAAFLVPSCNAKDCPMHSGATASETRSLSPFSEIVLNGKINLILTQDSTQQVTVSAGKNLLPGVQTVVSGNVLTIQDNNTCLLRDPSDQVNIYISSNQWQELDYYGAGDVSSTNTLLASQFMVDCWVGSGTIRLDMQAGEVNALVRNENATVVLTGTADSAYVYCGDAGSVDLSGFATDAVGIDHESIRAISVNASRALHANIVYKGNVYYKNDPPLIDTFITSTGRLIHLQ